MSIKPASLGPSDARKSKKELLAELRELRAQIAVLNGAGGNIREVVQDITDRRRAEETLSRNLAILAKSEEIGHLGSWSIDFDMEKFVVSDELYRVHGIVPGTVELKRDFLLKLIHPGDMERFREYYESVRQEGRLGGIDYRVVWSDGSVHYVHCITDSVVRGPDDRVKKASGIAQDITERKQAEEELKTAKMQAELYLDLMGHDITNMNQALVGYLEIMDVMRESGEIDKGLIDSSIEVINRSSRMINDVKKLTQLPAGKVSLKNVDVCEVLSAVKSKYSNIQGRSITINYGSGQDCIVRADDLLKDVFDNLVDNAIRHSKGPVTIDLAIDRVKIEGKSFLRVTVTDTGPGIPDDLKKKIFMSLTGDVDKTSRRGFGLYLVRTLIDRYHGKVWVEDRVPGDHTQGVRFVVMLPAVEK
jgi:PAS domain S-box-containing protein